MKALILTCAIFALVACSQTTKGSFCAISSPLRFADKAVDAMSDSEVKDVLAHNRKGQKLCGWRQ